MRFGPMCVEDAILHAVLAHRGQVDAGGAPYILHTLRVMLAQDTEDARIVAVLHDVLEDANDVTLAENNLWDAGLSHIQLAALRALTRAPHQPYQDYVKQVATNPLARQVKLADLLDNMNVMRLGRPLTAADVSRDAKYRAAYELLSTTL